MQQNKTVRIPSLSENTFLRYFNFIALYFAQGVPEGMLAFGIPAWMAMNGKSPSEIANFAIVVVLPWSFKILVAPLIDRYTYLSMGRKRPWVIIGQLGLVLSFAYMAYIPDPLNNLNQFMLAGFIVSFFGAFQDVATDGMAVDIIPAEQQAKANGLMWGSKISGISISLALGSWILNKYGYTASILTLSAIISFIMFVPILLRERNGEKILPWTQGKAAPEAEMFQLENWREIFKSLYSVFILRNSLLIAGVLFFSQGAFKFLSTLLPVFTVKVLGWTNVEYAQYFASAKLIGGISGMLLGGILIDKFGKKRMLSIYFFCLILLISFLALNKTYWGNKSVIYSFMVLFNSLYTFSCIGLFAIAMQCCWRKVSASQFTLYMTIANLGQMSFAALINPISSTFNWQISLLFFAIFLVLTWLILYFLNIEKQIELVEELELKDIEVKSNESSISNH